jgi:hypothetical protein
MPRESHMARGWESKSIEAQQDEAARSRSPKPRLTPEQQIVRQQKQTLELQRARVADDLERATAPHHRSMLQGAIAAIDEQLAKLDR